MERQKVFNSLCFIGFVFSLTIGSYGLYINQLPVVVYFMSLAIIFFIGTSK